MCFLLCCAGTYSNQQVQILFCCPSVSIAFARFNSYHLYCNLLVLDVMSSRFLRHTSWSILWLLPRAVPWRHVLYKAPETFLLLRCQLDLPLYSSVGHVSAGIHVTAGFWGEGFPRHHGTTRIVGVPAPCFRNYAIDFGKLPPRWWVSFETISNHNDNTSIINTILSSY